ncbi:MAG: glycosyltransferase family 4 protein [Bacteroidales bacterium]|nr:glycosyltransferase family 4 protein [Bacteroidales bacterium]
MKKIIRTATVPLSLDIFCRGILRELSEEYQIVVASSPLPELDSIARREGVRTVGVPMQRKIAPLRDLVSLFRLIAVFRKERPDMVHSITPKAGLLSMMAARVTRVPVRVHTFTGLVFPYAKGVKRPLLWFTDHLTAACATHVIPEGEGVKNDLLSHKVTHKSLKVLGNGNMRGVDLTYYQRTADVLEKASALRRRFGISGSDFVFLFVGRLDHDKGIDELLHAFNRLRNEGAVAHLLLAGAEDPDGKPLLESTRQLMAVSPGVHVSDGWLEDVRPWYAAADALVHPSYREGFPNVVIEAGAMELASIVTDINGSREIIHEDENGVIIRSHDEMALYEAMKAFLQNPDKVYRMASLARAQVADRYEQSYVRQCLKIFYHTVLQ